MFGVLKVCRIQAVGMWTEWIDSSCCSRFLICNNCRTTLQGAVKSSGSSFSRPALYMLLDPQYCVSLASLYMCVCVCQSKHAVCSVVTLVVRAKGRVMKKAQNAVMQWTSQNGTSGRRMHPWCQIVNDCQLLQFCWFSTTISRDHP